METRFILALFLFGGATISASAQSGPSEAQQRDVCMGDALRLCAAYIPDRGRITDCMLSKRAQLSAQCRAVFASSIQTSTSPQLQKR